VAISLKEENLWEPDSLKFQAKRRRKRKIHPADFSPRRRRKNAAGRQNTRGRKKKLRANNWFRSFHSISPGVQKQKANPEKPQKTDRLGRHRKGPLVGRVNENLKSIQIYAMSVRGSFSARFFQLVCGGKAMRFRKKTGRKMSTLSGPIPRGAGQHPSAGPPRTPGGLERPASDARPFVLSCRAEPAHGGITTGPTHGSVGCLAGPRSWGSLRPSENGLHAVGSGPAPGKIRGRDSAGVG